MCEEQRLRRAAFQGHHRAPRPHAAGPARSYPLRFTLVVLVTALSVGVGIGVGVLTLNNTRSAVRRLSDTVLREVREQTVDKTGAFLGVARPSLGLLRDLLSRDAACGIHAPEEPRDAALRERGRHLIRTLKSSTHYDMVYFGDSKGYFTGARRRGRGYLVEFRWPSDGGTRRRAYFVTEDDSWERVVLSDRRPFDPRTRPWYVSAASSRAFVWTDPYVFHEAGMPGITAALPVTGAGGQLRGVVGVDIYLHDLDGFVKRFRESGRYVCILSSQGRVVAQPGRSAAELTRYASGEGGNDEPAALPSAAMSKDPLLKAIGRAKIGAATRDDIRLDAGGESYLAASYAMNTEGRDWSVIVAVPRREVVGVVQTNTLITFAACLLVMALSVLAGIYAARSIARPLHVFAGEMDQVANLDIPDRPSPRSRIQEVDEMGRALDRMKAGLRSYQRYVPAALVRSLHEAGDEARIGGKHARLTVSFADIKNFTGFAEGRDPAEVVERLGEFLELVEGQVSRYGGIVDKYSGDEVMALWGPPIAPLEDPEWCACEAALGYFEAMRAQSEATGQPPALQAAIGIHTGDALVGNIGSKVRLSYTAIGDAVNVASRVESLNRMYRTRILVTEATMSSVMDHFEARLVDKVAVKGRREGIRLYELLARHGELDELTQALCQQHYAAMKLYRERDWPAAHAAFMRVLETKPDDGPSLVLAERCAEFAANPPPSVWDGVYQVNLK